MLRKFTSIESWTQGKTPNLEMNEDMSYGNDTVLVLADGATDKTGIKYLSGKSGGRELAEIAVKTASKSLNVGYELADDVTQAVREFYRLGNQAALKDASKRAATTLVAARLLGDELVITQIGDSNVRVTFVGGSHEVLTNDKRIDIENANIRADYMRKQLDSLTQAPTPAELERVVAEGRASIQGRLGNQYKLQNNDTDKVYGYCFIDGEQIPRMFTDGTPTNYVKVFTYPANQVTHVELVSDGFYGEFPAKYGISDYKELYERIHKEDPYKFIKYMSTKPVDDATVIKATLA